MHGEKPIIGKSPVKDAAKRSATTSTGVTSPTTARNVKKNSADTDLPAHHPAKRECPIHRTLPFPRLLLIAVDKLQEDRCDDDEHGGHQQKHKNAFHQIFLRIIKVRTHGVFTGLQQEVFQQAVLAHIVGI